MSSLPDRDTAALKRKLREQMIAKRLQMTPAAAATSSSAVARHFADHPILAFAPSFAAYIAHRGELDVLGIFDLMARYRKVTALPAMTPQKNLIFRRWEKGEPLVKHASLGIEEPETTKESIMPALVLVPLVAFDAEGYRLGYGGGYYDRTIETMRQFENPPLFVGVAYTMQEVPRLPIDAHDQQLDGILTELGVSMFRRF